VAPATSVDRTGFYLLFIPALTLSVLGLGVAMMVFSMTQGGFQQTTKRGLTSLVGTLVVLALLVLAAKGYHPVKHG
jgi:hypothetical protein